MNTNTTFNNTTMPAATVKAIQRRAQQLSTLDHGELAVLLARLEYEARALLYGRPAAGVTAALAAVDVLAGVGK